MRLPIHFFVLSFCLGGTLANAGTPDAVRIVDLAYEGDGCPEDSLALNLADDGLAFTVLMSEFVADAYESRHQRARASCRTRMRLAVSPGWSMGLFCADTRGFADLDRGARGRLRTSYKINGQPEVLLSQATLRGEYFDDYQQTDIIPPEDIAWTPCQPDGQVELELNTTALVRGEGLMTVDSLDGHFKQHYGVVWRPCDTPRDHGPIGPSGHTATYTQNFQLQEGGVVAFAANGTVAAYRSWSMRLFVDGVPCATQSVPAGSGIDANVACTRSLDPGPHSLRVEFYGVSTVYSISGHYLRL